MFMVTDLKHFCFDLKPCCSYILSVLPGKDQGHFIFLFIQRLYALYTMIESLGNVSYITLWIFSRTSQQMWKQNFRKWMSIFMCCLGGIVWDGYRIYLERIVYGSAGPSFHLCFLVWKHRRALWLECCSESILVLSQAHWRVHFRVCGPKALSEK